MATDMEVTLVFTMEENNEPRTSFLKNQSHTKKMKSNMWHPKEQKTITYRQRQPRIKYLTETVISLMNVKSVKARKEKNDQRELNS